MNIHKYRICPTNEVDPFLNYRTCTYITLQVLHLFNKQQEEMKTIIQCVILDESDKNSRHGYIQYHKQATNQRSAALLSKQFVQTEPRTVMTEWS